MDWHSSAHPISTFQNNRDSQRHQDEPLSKSENFRIRNDELKQKREMKMKKIKKQNKRKEENGNEEEKEEGKE